MDNIKIKRINKIFSNIKFEVELFGKENGITWKRIKTRNFYISNTFRYNDHYIILFKSYNTIVGFVDCTENIFYEIGKYEPNLETIKKISLYFNVSTDYLLGLTDEKKPYKRKE